MISYPQPLSLSLSSPSTATSPCTINTSASPITATSLSVLSSAVTASKLSAGLVVSSSPSPLLTGSQKAAGNIQRKKRLGVGYSSALPSTFVPSKKLKQSSLYFGAKQEIAFPRWLWWCTDTIGRVRIILNHCNLAAHAVISVQPDQWVLHFLLAIGHLFNFFNFR